MKRKEPWISLLFSLLALGGGHLYVGHMQRFVVALGVLFVLLGGLVLGDAGATFAGFLLANLVLLIFFLFNLIDPAILAGKQKYETRWYTNKWTYIAYVLLVPLVMGYCKNHTQFRSFRENILGYQVYSLESTALSPTVLEYEYVLVDTKAVKRHELTLGDVVVVQGNGQEKGRARFVEQIDGDNVRVGLHKSWDVSDPLLNNVVVPISEIEGKVTCILYSHDFGRIGKSVTFSPQMPIK